MSKNKKTDVDPKKVSKEDAKQPRRKIREGKEDYSILSDDDVNENAYPRKHTADKQYDHEPEFLERDSEDKDEG
jgi:hypothetical protein